MPSLGSGLHDRLARRFATLNPEHPTYRWFVLANVMIGTFMAVLDATIVNVALPKLMAHFGVAIDQIEWVLTAYLLIFVVMLPTTGWLADRFGYKLIFTLGLFTFTVGSFMTSLSWSFNSLIAFRVVQGAGAGALLPVGMAILTREFPPDKRGIALGFWSVSASASVSLGPTLGGWLIDRFSWRMIFDVNVPVGMAGILASLVILREYRLERTRSFDLFGFLSLAVALTALLLALANGNADWNTGGWTSNFILACFAIAVIGFAAFLTNEIAVPNPLIDLTLFRSRNFAISNLALFIFGIGMFGSNFLLPIYLQNSLGYTPFQAGLVFLPVGVILGLTAPLAGAFSDRFNGKIPAFIGLVLLAYSMYLYGSLSLETEKHGIMVPLYIRGFAMGLVFSPLTTIAISEMSHQKMAQASGLINVIRQLGGSVGVAIFGAVLTQRTTFHMAILGGAVSSASDTYRSVLTRVAGWAMQVAGSTAGEARQQAAALIAGRIGTEAFIRSVGDVFLAASVVVAASAVPVLFLRGRPLRNQLPGRPGTAPVGPGREPAPPAAAE